MPQQTRILVVDDEPSIVRLVQLKLEADRMIVRTASTGAEALEALADEPVDLVVLDVTMPGMDGFEVLRQIRTTSTVPVLMLTAHTLERDKLQGLTSGADDYLTKPFSPDELSARITAILRRTSGLPAGDRLNLDYGSVVINLEQRRVTRGGEEVHFSRTEWELLYELVTNPGKVMLHRELLTRVWGAEFGDESPYLRTWVSRLRAKLGDEVPITTMAGIGYRMESPA
jgi:two-component system, OmpR family, KDP operon response regulator KdpE